MNKRATPTTPEEGAPNPSPAEPKRARQKPVRSQPAVSTLVRAYQHMDAGDRFAQAGEREQALKHYGLALNDYLREGLHRLASSAARRMIERYPDVVRARMTLAALSLAEGLRVVSAGEIRSTLAAFNDYVTAARAAGQEAVAIRQLRRFAEATESPVVRARISEFLQLLGDAEGGELPAPEALQERFEPEGGRSATDAQYARWVEILLGTAAEPREASGGESRGS